MIGKIDPSKKEVTVIGGGIAGLLAAYQLDRKGYEVTLLEQNHQLGGLIQTEETPWGISESAAHSLLVTETMKAFFDEIGFELTPLRTDSRARYILREGQLRKFPLTIGESFGALIRAYFVLASKEKNPEEFTVEEWGRRYLGDAALKYLLTPMIHGVYGASPSQITIGTAFPSLMIPHGHSLLSFQLSRVIRPNRKNTSSRPRMMAPKRGMADLIHCLEQSLRLKLQDRLITGKQITELPDSKTRNLVLCVPVENASALLKSVDSPLAQAFNQISYTPLVSVTVFVQRRQFNKIPKGIGVLIPENEKVQSLGILFNSSSFEDRIKKDDCVSLTIFLGGTRRPDAVQLKDSEIIQWVIQDLKSIWGSNESFNVHVKGNVTDFVEGYVIHRWQKAIPQYNEALKNAWSAARKGWCSQPGHVLFGNYTGKVSIRGMIESSLSQF